MKKTFVVSLIWGLILVLSACQNTNLDVEDLDTANATPNRPPVLKENERSR